MTELMALIVREAAARSRTRSPKCARRSIILRYYALRARADFAGPMPLPGPAGERNEIESARARRLRLHLAVEFSAVDLHRPDRRGARRRQCGHRQARRADAADRRRRGAAAASRPGCRARSSICCRGPARRSARGSSPTRASPGSPLPARPRPRAISTSTLARRPGPIVPFIAETGGQNAMIVDSSALAEQVVADVLASAFDSAGQRCSAAAPALCAGRHRRPAVGDAGGSDGGAGDRRSGLDRHRCRPGHRRRGKRGAGAARRADGA